MPQRNEHLLAARRKAWLAEARKYLRQNPGARDHQINAHLQHKFSIPWSEAQKIAARALGR